MLLFCFTYFKNRQLNYIKDKLHCTALDGDIKASIEEYETEKVVVAMKIPFGIVSQRFMVSLILDPNLGSNTVLILMLKWP